MIKMLVIADDFTGALDTGVQFTRQGLYTKVSTNINFDFNNVVDELDVLVIDAQSRHLPSKDAYEIIREISKRAVECDIKYVYKKTDSALRGNIGSELHGLLDGANGKAVHFIPALPKFNRTTKKGIHYINELPVAESVFGKDPFDPVKYSNVLEIIASQTAVESKSLENADLISGEESGIVVYDASSEIDLTKIAKELFKYEDTKFFAGCAGFASVLPEFLGVSKRENRSFNFDDGLLVACGSVNGISLKQVAVGAENGFPYSYLDESQKLEKDWANKNKSEYEQMIKFCVDNEFVIFDANNNVSGDVLNPTEFAKEKSISLDEIRTNIAEFIGQMLKDVLDSGAKKNIMIIGGDTLFAFLKRVGIDLLEPVGEVFDGVVLSVIEYKNNKYNIISKSGGFGESDLLLNMRELIENK